MFATSTYVTRALTGLLLLLVLATAGMASMPLSWAKRAGGTGDDTGNGIAAAADGGSFVVGSFTGTATFGPGEANQTALTAAGGSDLFLARYNANGALLWAKRAGGTGADTGNDVGVAADGSAVITGTFSGTATFATGITLTAAGGTDIFVAKYDSAGTVLWAKRAGGTGTDVAKDLAEIADGSFAITGAFTGTATFATGVTLTAVGNEDIFVARYSGTGALTWAKRASSAGEDIGHGVSMIADGSVWVVGEFGDTVTFGPGEAQQTVIPCTGGSDLFIARYAPTGALAWAKRANGSGTDSATAVSALPDGTAFITGAFKNTVIFAPGEPNATSISSTGGYEDFFIASYAGTGALNWAKRGGGNGSDTGNSITALADGELLVTGTFKGAATFGPGEATETALTAAGFQDIFLMRLTAAGAMRWAVRIGGRGHDIPNSLATLPDGAGAVMTGSFDDATTFGPGEPNQTVLTPASSNTDVCLAKFGTMGICAEPTISPDGGGFVSASVTVTASSTTAGAVFRYTTDGTTPSFDSPLLPGTGLVIDHTTTLKVRAFLYDWSPSATHTSVFEFGTSQPDLLIQDGATLRGDNVYNDLTAQTATRTMLSNQTATYDVTLQNDGSLANAMRLTANVTGVPTGWTVQILADLTDITTEALGTGWTTPNPLAANGTLPIHITVTPDGTIVGDTALSVQLTATSVADGVSTDAVLATTTKSRLTTVDLTASPVSYTAANIPVTLTATQTGGGPALFAFRAKVNGVWSNLRGYDPSSTFVWTPTVAGTYLLQVLAKEVGSTQDPDASLYFSYTIKPALTAVQLDANVSSPTAVGTPVRLTAAATGGARVRYWFRVSDGTTWSDLSPYSTTTYASWTPTAPGTYTLEVQAKDVDSVSPPDATQQMTLVVNAPATALALTATPTGVTAAGTPVTLTANPTGGGTLEYRYRVQDGTGTWTDIQPYGTTATASWVPAAAGTYTLAVLAREVGCPDSFTLSAVSAYTVKPAVTAVALSASITSPTATGIPVRLSAVITGGARPHYRYRVYDGTAWTDLVADTTSPTYTWTPTAPGTYTLEVQAWDANSPAPPDATSQITLVVNAAVSAVNLTMAPTAPTVVGAAVTLTATPTDGGTLEYAFRALLNGVATDIAAYGATTTATWTPAAAGNYTLQVMAREVGSTKPYDVMAVKAYTVKAPISAATLTPTNITSPTATGIPVQLSAQVTGGAHPHFRYRVYDGTAWTVLVADTTSPTCTWTPTAPGTYTLEVATWDADSPTPPDATTQITIVVAAPVSAVSLATNPAVYTAANVPVTLTATPTDGGTLEYRFRVLSGGVWTDIAPYGAANTTTWTPAVDGSYTLQVMAREVGSLQPFDVMTVLAFTVKPAVSAVTLTTSLTSPTATGIPVKLIAGATGGARLHYRYRVFDGTSWTDLVADTTSPIFTWTPSTPGTYTLEVQTWDADSTNPPDATTQVTIVVNAPISAVSLATSPDGQTVVDVPVTLTATPTDGGTLEYRFRVQSGGVWTEIAAYGASTTATWTPTTVGNYTLQVMAREVGSTRPFDVNTVTAYAVRTTVSAVTLATSVASPTAVGIAVKLTARATGGANLRYWFRVSNGTTWTNLQAYSAANTATWTPRLPGDYTVAVYVRDDGHPSAFQVSKLLPFTVRKAVSGLTLTLDPPDRTATGIPVTLTATATDGGTLLYWFRVQRGTVWTDVQTYAASHTCTWTPTDNGGYTVEVMVKEQGSTKVYDAYTIKSYVAMTPISAVSLTGNVASPTAVGIPITLKAAVTGGVRPRYQFRVSDGTTWTDLTPSYGVGGTFVWTPRAAGTYTVQVQAMEWGNPNPPDAVASLTYTIVPAVSAVTLTTDPVPADTAVGDVVHLTATATGGARLSYWFRVKNGTTWTDLQAYSTSTTCDWTPTAPGNYTLEVLVKEDGSPKINDVYAVVGFFVKPPITAVSLSGNLSSPTAVGVLVRLTATVTGGAAVRYWYRVNDGTGWTDLLAYSPASLVAWIPPAPGTYTLEVRAKENNSTALYAASDTVTYKILPAMTGVMLAADPPSGTTPAGTTFVLTAAAQGGGVTPLYWFRVKRLTDTTWTDLQAYGTSTTCTWTPTEAGTYMLEVLAMETGSRKAYDVYMTLVYTVLAP